MAFIFAKGFNDIRVTADDLSTFSTNVNIVFIFVAKQLHIACFPAPVL